MLRLRQLLHPARAGLLHSPGLPRPVGLPRPASLLRSAGLPARQARRELMARSVRLTGSGVRRGRGRCFGRAAVRVKRGTESGSAGPGGGSGRPRPRRRPGVRRLRLGTGTEVGHLPPRPRQGSRFLLDPAGTTAHPFLGSPSRRLCRGQCQSTSGGHAPPPGRRRPSWEDFAGAVVDPDSRPHALTGSWGLGAGGGDCARMRSAAARASLILLQRPSRGPPAGTALGLSVGGYVSSARRRLVWPCGTG